MNPQNLLDSVGQWIDEPLPGFILKFVGAIALVVFGRLVIKGLVNTLRKSLGRTQVDETLVKFLSNIAYYGLMIILIVVALSLVGVPMTSIIAVLGAATLAIGLALQDSLGNLAGGVLIIVLKPYRLGDYIEANGEQGFVEDIQLFHSRLLTRDNKSVYVPNSAVMGGNIINYSQKGLIRLDLIFGIGYGDDIKKAKEILKEIVQSTALVAQTPPPAVAVSGLGESSVDFVVRPYVRVEDGPAVTFEITEQVKLRFDEAGISIPFPQRDVHLYQPN